LNERVAYLPQETLGPSGVEVDYQKIEEYVQEVEK